MAGALADEWLETDGAGGFASGTSAGVRTRRYHALLLSATTPPDGRMVLVSGLEVWLVTPRGRFALSTQYYAPDVAYPDGQRRISAFFHEPWPRWTFECEDGSAVTFELCVSPETRETALRFELRDFDDEARLEVRPLLSGRDFHHLHHENPHFGWEPELRGDTLVFRPYPSVPPIAIRSNGAYRHDPLWYRNFCYAEERARGLDCTEDLASPGTLSFGIGRGSARMTLAASAGSVPTEAEELFDRELVRRESLGSPLERAAEAYVVRGRGGTTLIAGYPWFADWGRDTFVALRGLCLRPERLHIARDILLTWADGVSEGMLPNRFSGSGSSPEYNSVDAALWFVVAVHDYLEASRVEPAERRRLHAALERVLEGYARGTRHGIRLDGDGLLAAGAPGLQLTWMDAKVGDQVVTPRAGKPVEVQALWLNALRIGSAAGSRWAKLFETGQAAFRERFWCGAEGCLYDVIDVDHVPGAADASVRPNQIFAVGGLPFPLLDGERARRVVDKVERHLLTPLGLRSLSPEDPRYRGRYEGGVWERDSAYHQGTAWPWLMGAFVEAWLRVHGAGPEQKQAASRRFAAPLLAHLEVAGLGHVSELADGDPPHAPRGAPFQAWSLAELLRILDLLRAA
jgi:predicted glycogen debranching enzyme